MNHSIAADLTSRRLFQDETPGLLTFEEGAYDDSKAEQRSISARGVEPWQSCAPCRRLGGTHTCFLSASF